MDNEKSVHGISEPLSIVVLNLTIQDIKNDNMINLKQTVINDIGISKDNKEIRQGKILSYRLDFLLNELLLKEDYSYDKIILNEFVDNNLEEPFNCSLEDTNGISMGVVIHDKKILN